MWSHVKVFVLMAGLTALFGGLGSLVGGTTGVVVAIAIAAAMNVAAYFWSSKVVLRMYGARVVTEREAPALYEMVDRLRRRAGLPMPTVAIAPHAQPNAFATGRGPRHAVVCMTAGLLRTLDRAELEGVVAHELAHIKNRDMLLQTVTATVAGAVANLANIAQFSAFFGGTQDEEASPNVVTLLLTTLVAPVAASIIQLAVSRQREFQADALGAQISGRPLALAGALAKLEAGAQAIPMAVTPAVAPIAQVNPLAWNGGPVARLFSTHPPTHERIARLTAMARETSRLRSGRLRVEIA
jgi:heat shock protein HtpX